MRSVVSVVLLAVLGGCFSKPDFKGRPDDGGVDADAPIDGAMCLPGEVTSDPPLTRLQFQQLTAGGTNACGIDPQTQLWCWGRNEQGQLGRGTPLRTGTPQLVGAAGEQTGWTSVAVGREHACGIRNGGVYCWGRNDYRQSSATSTAGPVGITAVTIPGETPARVFAGPEMTCAITTVKHAYCWGRLDPVTTTASGVTQLAPTGASELVEIALSENHACALADGNGMGVGDVYCWGKNDYLQVGGSPPAPGASALFASPLRHVGAFSSLAVARDATCAIKSGQLVCWGFAGRGHLGPNAVDPSAELVVDARTDWSDVAMGFGHVCAIRGTGGEVYCYGKSLEGAQGTGRFAEQPAIPGAAVATNARTITSGTGFACALDTTNLATCWGSNEYGSLGNSQIASKTAPSQVALPVGSCELVQKVVAGDRHTCAVVGEGTAPGRVYCWGSNDQHQIDETSAALRSTPTLVSMDPVVQLAAGGTHSCARKPDGSLLCWGDNDSYQLARTGIDGTNPVMPPDPQTPWVYVAAGSTTTCAIAQGGTLFCWGSGATLTSVASPRDLGRVSINNWPWQSVEIGSSQIGGYVIGVVLDGTRPRVVGFGDSCALDTAAGTLIDPMSPVDILSSAVFEQVQVAAADQSGGHACIHYTMQGSTTPKVTCWGRNESAQVAPGLDACVVHEDPVEPQGGWRVVTPGTATIAAAGAHSCALNAGGQVYCWGANNNYELGGIQNQATNPQQVTTQPTFAEITTAGSHSCGIDAMRKNVFCWGKNTFGELGDKSSFHPSPTPAGLIP